MQYDEFRRDESTKPIISFDNDIPYNGKVNLITQPDIDTVIRMHERIQQKNKALPVANSMSGIWEPNALTNAYLSPQNVQIIQNAIRAKIYELSEERFFIMPPNVNNLTIIMRSYYLQYVRHYDNVEDIRAEIVRLNNMVIKDCVDRVFSECQAYVRYCEDQSTMAMPLDMPKKIDRDYKHLQIRVFK